MQIRGTKPDTDVQFGSFDSDTFIGARSSDEFYGDYGDDVIEGKRGSDLLLGGEGADLIFGGRGNDTLYGEGGVGNRLEGGTGNDTLGASLIGGSVTTLVGGRGGDLFNLAFADEQPLSVAVIEDFQEGDRLQLSFSSPVASLASAETFATLDTNFDGRLDDADDYVVAHGTDLHLGVVANGAFTGIAIFLNVDHVDTSTLIG